jgi:hypothetical protein
VTQDTQKSLKNAVIDAVRVEAPNNRLPKTTTKYKRQMKQIQHSTWTSTKHNRDSVLNVSRANACQRRESVGRVRASASLVLQP